VDARERLATIIGAFLAHLCAKLAVSVVVAPTLLSAQFTSSRARLKHRPQYLDVLTGPAHGKLRSRVADVSTIGARADALAHVHFFSRTGIRTRGAHICAKHRVSCCCSEGLIEVALDVRVQGNHLGEGHRGLQGWQSDRPTGRGSYGSSHNGTWPTADRECGLPNLANLPPGAACGFTQPSSSTHARPAGSWPDHVTFRRGGRSESSLISTRREAADSELFERTLCIFHHASAQPLRGSCEQFEARSKTNRATR
jgi:hypothetical protein